MANSEKMTTTAVDNVNGHHGNGEQHHGNVKFHVVGSTLAEKIGKGLSPTWAALIARSLVIGEAECCCPTVKQACALTGANASYVRTALKLSPAEIAEIKQGKLSLSAVHNKKTDAQIDRFIRQAGADRVLAALDRATAPTTITTVMINGVANDNVTKAENEQEGFAFIAAE